MGDLHNPCGHHVGDPWIRQTCWRNWRKSCPRHEMTSDHGPTSHNVLVQWYAEVWWCPGRLLDWLPPYQILVLSSGVWWSLLLDIRCLWRHNMTPYSRFQANVLAKFLDTTTCIFSDAGEASGQGGGAAKQLRAMESYKKQKESLSIMFASAHPQCWLQK